MTKGPSAEADRAKSIGRAAHIHAAAPGGPRYDSTQTPEQRRSFENGIWLCANHAAEVDADDSRFTAEELRSWKRETIDFAARLFGRPPIGTGPASRGMIAIGPETIAVGSVLRTARGVWTLAIDEFVLGDQGTLGRFADAFSALAMEDCFVCLEAEGIGRMLVEGPTIDLTNGISVELHTAAPLPVEKARAQFDANLRGADLALDLSGDEPDLYSDLRQVSGAARIAQILTSHLGTCKGGYTIGQEHGSRVAELHGKLGSDRLASLILIETIRLATVPHEDSMTKAPHVPFDFIERVRGVRLLPTTSTEFAKVAIVLDVYGIGSDQEFVVPISLSTESLGPHPTLPSRSPVW